MADNKSTLKDEFWKGVVLSVVASVERNDPWTPQTWRAWMGPHLEMAIRQASVDTVPSPEPMEGDQQPVDTVESPEPMESDGPPVDFMCPITQDLMNDPVVCADGHSYERAAIVQWLSNHNTSPKTNVTLVHKNLTPNHTLRGAIEQWSELHPSR